MNSSSNWIIGVILLLAAGAAGYYYYFREPTPAIDSAAQPVAPLQATGSEEPAAQYPVPAPESVAEPLPPLHDSDPSLRESLQALLGSTPLAAVLAPQQIIERVVITIDTLDREAVSPRYRSVPKTPGEFIVAGDGDTLTLGPENEARYRPIVSVLQALDTPAAVNFYFRYYPLFQQAYRGMGKRGSFNDRLIQIIDHLLATPQIEGPVLLVKYQLIYRFADQDLENRSSGQKAMIRIGPSNAAVVREKLRELRQAIVARSVQA